MWSLFRHFLEAICTEETVSLGGNSGMRSVGEYCAIDRRSGSVVVSSSDKRRTQRNPDTFS